MFQIKKLYQLWKIEGMSVRAISRLMKIPKSTLYDYITRFKENKISEEIIETLTEEEIIEILFKKRNKPAKSKKSPDFQNMFQELKFKHVTLKLLWEEYLQENPDGYRYSEYCHLFQNWRKSLKVCMRQQHKAGEKMFVDYAGMTMKIYNGKTGESSTAQIFVAALGSSGYSYAEATSSQNVEDFINSHINAFEFFGGTTKMLVPDNLKSAVIKADYYNPRFNSTYEEMADHYNTLINPARVRKPKDKAKVELSVLLVERWILAKLRHNKFFSLKELNNAIKPLITKLNDKIIKKIGKSRSELFEITDKLALSKLPPKRYYLNYRKLCIVDRSYHITLDGSFYSVPSHLIGKEVLVQYNKKDLEIYYQEKRIATHVRQIIPGSKSTLNEHMTKAHLAYAKSQNWNIGRLLSWANWFGENTKQLIEWIYINHPNQALTQRCCLGILNTAKGCAKKEVEKTSKYMLEHNKFSVREFRSILKNKAYNYYQPDIFEEVKVKSHSNIRGSKSYS